MSDARRNRDPHKVRIKLSGGLEDLKDLESLIRDDRQDLELGFIESVN
jgi:hypothetical protein